MVKNADYIIDMGLKAKGKGGLVIATGSPEKPAKEYYKKGSHTGEYLAKELKQMHERAALLHFTSKE